MGHSFGGAVGLGAIQGGCFPIICPTTFSRPEALKAGIFYGTRFGGADISGSVPPIFNDKIPVGLIGGNLDGVISLDKVLESYIRIEDPPKLLVSVAGANHYGIANDDDIFRDPIRPTLKQEIATETIARWSGLFLRAHVLEDKQAFNYIYTTIGDTEDENVTTTSISVKVPEPSDSGIIFFIAIGITKACIGKGRIKSQSSLDNVKQYS